MDAEQLHQNSPSPGTANAQRTEIEIAILNHALKKGYIHPNYHKQLEAWHRSGQCVDGSALFSAICVNLNGEQIESLRTLFEILQVRSQIDSQAAVPQAAVVPALDPREKILEDMRGVLKDHPHFSPQADLFLDVHEKLGEGGMGAVYRVRDKRLGRNAAYKVIQDHAASPYAIERFLREIKITARLDHPSIPPVYDSGTNVHGEHFMLMRVIEGREFSDMIQELHKRKIDFQRDKLKVSELLEVLVKVGETVAYAHDNGIIHRDLKPANILVGEFGEVMVMDWGLAKHMNSRKDDRLDENSRSQKIDELQTQESNLTQAGNLMGTLGYMAPEQAEDCTAVNELADVFAMGAILTEILTGSSPIEGGSPFVKLTNTVNGAILSPDELVPSVPIEINAVAAKALKFNPAQRTKSVEEFTADLKCYLAGREVSAYHYTSFEQVICYVKQNPAVILGAPLLVVVSVIAFSLWLKLSLTPAQLKDTKTQLAKSEEARSEIEETLRLTQQKLTRESRELAQFKNRPKNVKTAGEWLMQANIAMEKGESLRRIQLAADKALQVSKRAPQILRAAANIYARGQYPGMATTLLRELSKRDQKDCEALFLLHKLAAKNESRALEFSAELKEINKRSKLAKDSEFLCFAKAAKFLEEKQLKKARIFLARIEKFNKNFPWGHYYLAHIDLIDGRLIEAAAGFKKVIHTIPNLSGAWAGLGEVCLRRNQFKEASIYVNRALDLNNKRRDLYLTRGLIRKELGQFKESADDLTVALRWDSKNIQAYIQRAEVRTELELIGGAVQDYSQALRLDPDNKKALIARAQLKLKRRNEGSALVDLERARKTDPTDASIGLLIAQTVQKSGDNHKALQEYSAALKLDNKLLPAYIQRGLLHLAFQNVKAAMSDFNQAIVLDKQCAEAYYCRIQLYLRQNKKKEAVADAKKFVTLEPRSQRSMEICEQLLWKPGQR